MTDPIQNLIAAGYRATMWLDGKGLSDEGLAVLIDLRSALNAIAAAEARPEPAAEPSTVDHWIEKALDNRSVGDWHGTTACIIKAIQALAREVRR